MNKKSRRTGNSGWGLYALLILTIVLMWYVSTGASKGTSITKAEFIVALETGRVDAVKIAQNPQVPTGSLTILMEDDSTRTMYVSDVNEMQELMQERGFGNFQCVNVPQETWLEKIFPYLLIFGICFIFFIIMNNNAPHRHWCRQ